MTMVYIGEIINEQNSIHHIIDNIYLGNMNSRNYLYEKNIDRVVEIGTIEECQKYTQLNCEKLTINIEDNREVEIDKYFQSVWNFIVKDNKNVLIHCKVGTSRSVCFVISYLIKYKFMNYEEAINLIKNKRNDEIYTKPNIGFMKILRKL